MLGRKYEQPLTWNVSDTISIVNIVVLLNFSVNLYLTIDFQLFA